MMDRHAATSFKAQAKQLGQVLSSSPFLMAFSLSVVVQGVLLASLESYWQPYFIQLLVSDSQLWILGLISASIFAVSVLESIIGKRFISHMRPSGLYFLAFALIFVMQLVLSQSNTLLQCFPFFLFGCYSERHAPEPSRFLNSSAFSLLNWAPRWVMISPARIDAMMPESWIDNLWY